MTPRDPDFYNRDLPQQWAARNGLRLDSDLRDNSQALSSVIDRRKSALVQKVEALRDLSHEVFDHPQYFSKPIGGNVVAVVTAPYLGVVCSELGSTANLNARAHAIAAELELFVRVGHPADTIYLTRFASQPTVPIVWWNPSRIALDIPTIDDPYPRFAGDF
ncbi:MULTISPECIES: hypothetical protein [unclassified Microbacterium]|uniref:hypothetical protein n=1 Tax=unclassified Microbacterium TaxID=2609290 RepID=UPI0004935CB5|nr:MULTISPECIES: hypothetical protein [unclassified Microbacterium]